MLKLDTKTGFHTTHRKHTTPNNLPAKIILESLTRPGYLIVLISCTVNYKHLIMGSLFVHPYPNPWFSKLEPQIRKSSKSSLLKSRSQRTKLIERISTDAGRCCVHNYECVYKVGDIELLSVP